MTKQSPSSKPRKALWQRILIWIGIALLAFIVIILLMGLIPTSTKGLQPDPNPTISYDDAVARFNQMVAEESANVKASGQSILMTHGAATEDVFVLSARRHQRAA